MKIIKKFLHDYLGWHNGNGDNIGFDGCSFTSRCSICNKKVLQDSQGNWFLSWIQD